eukprot:Tbor_TRINITY_DN4505_c0_g1::TRINITY_DN4505_c0_g1_i1::g.15822::m.15822/K07890/RAB21; Ras-related protein Rab-21
MVNMKVKVVMLGEGRVGKTSLIERFVNNSFEADCVSTCKATMYADTKVRIGDTVVDVSIWDTAGQERYHALAPVYYRKAHGAVLTYDITDKDSFDRAKVWLKELHQAVGDDIQIVIVGNKCDLERDRKVNKKEAEEFAQLHKAPHFLCSAKLDLRVELAFTELVKKIVNLEKMDSKEGGVGGRRRTNTGGPSAPRPKGVKINMFADETTEDNLYCVAANTVNMSASVREPKKKKDCEC